MIQAPVPERRQLFVERSQIRDTVDIEIPEDTPNGFDQVIDLRVEVPVT